MKLIKVYIDELAEKMGTKSHAETMKILGLGRASYNKYENGGSISDKKAIELAEILRISPLEIIGYSKALKPQISREEKNLWLNLAKREERKRMEKIND